MDLNFNKQPKDKKAQPTVNDALPAIATQIEAFEKSIQNLKKSFNTMDEKLEKFNQHDPKLNVDIFTSTNQKFIDELKKSNYDLIVKFNTISTALEQNKNSNSIEINYLYAFVHKIGKMFSILLAMILVFTFVDTMASLGIAENTETAKEYQLKLVQSENSFKQYLYDHNDEEKYIKWTKRKQ
jgi:hypothetical protein